MPSKPAPAKRPAHRPRGTHWQPTEAERRLVELYTAIGYTQEQIAGLMGKSADSLQRHCRDELDNGALRVNAKVGGRLYQKAMSGDTASLIWWTKTRMGWSEKQAESPITENAVALLSLFAERLRPLV